MADLVGAVRLPEGACARRRTDVVVDVLVLQRREPGAAPTGAVLDRLAEGLPAEDGDSALSVNRYLLDHPEMVLGAHAERAAPMGRPIPAGPSFRPRRRSRRIELRARPVAAGIFRSVRSALKIVTSPTPLQVGTAADGATIKEGSYRTDGACARLDGARGGQDRRAGDGRHHRQRRRIIRGFCRSATRCARCCAPRPPTSPGPAQVRLRIAYGTFVRGFGPINPPRSRELRRRWRGPRDPSPAEPRAFADDPDCWLVASIEDYDLESGLARMGPIFRERVIAPPAAPLIATAADALAVTLNETGRVDIDHLAELLDRDPETALAQLGETVFRNPATEAWETDDAYLSGPSAPSSRSPRRRPSAIRSIGATSRRCGGCSPRTCVRRTSPRVSARRGFPPPTSRPSPPR